MNIIKREKYLEKIRVYYHKQLIKIITGQRRVGKSYMLLQIKEDLLLRKPKPNIIFIDKEKYEFDFISDYKDLINYVKSKQTKGMNCLIIDEIQDIKVFEKALRSLQSERNIDIYCTGSNNTMLSGELATYLSGRQIELRVHGLSYAEFLEFQHLNDSDNSLYAYLLYGGLPYIMHLPKSKEVIFDYLKNIYTTILYRDVVNRHHIRDLSFLENLLKYLAGNTGNLFSANNIAMYLKNQKSSKTVSVIINYLKHLEDAYFITSVKRKDIKGKKIFEIGEKYYFEDSGLRNAINGFNLSDMGQIIENAVFNHLRILGYDVYIGKSGDKEIDFIAEKEGETVYFQVTWKLSGNNVIEREFGNLMQIRDNFPKYVISMDNFPGSNTFKGIHHLHIRDFLLLSRF